MLYLGNERLEVAVSFVYLGSCSSLSLSRPPLVCHVSFDTRPEVYQVKNGTYIYVYNVTLNNFLISPPVLQYISLIGLIISTN